MLRQNELTKISKLKIKRRNLAKELFIEDSTKVLFTSDKKSCSNSLNSTENIQIVLGVTTHNIQQRFLATLMPPLTRSTDLRCALA